MSNYTSEQYPVEKAFQQNEGFFRQVWDRSSDAMALSDAEGIVLAANPAYLALYGYTEEQIIGHYYNIIFPEEQRDLSLQRYKRVFSGEMPTTAYESLVRRQDGTLRVVESHVSFITLADQSILMLSTLRDITLNKQLHMAELHRRLVLSQEEERAHLARELHDGPIQELALLGMGLASLRRTLHKEEVPPQLEEMHERLGQAKDQLREISVNLRPPLLDFGLVAAIRQCIQEHQRRQPDQIIETVIDPEITQLSEAMMLTFYRICKQALHNIQSHAEATHIWVRLQQVDSQVILEIADNGKGFIVPDNWAEFVSQKHLGMAGMAERANALGGALVVHSAPNQGTQIQVTVVLAHHKCESSLD